ncbi:MAG: nucleoside-diphosphate kinase [Deltaproteobacteria bacterium]|nr:nucleoside-diphosphate kinase [Deltaproteobacteria bacterium]
MQSKELEQTLVLIKPDALKNSLTGYVLSQLSEFHSGLRFAGLKVVYVSRMLAEEHYAEHRGKVFYPSLIEYIRGRIHYPDAPHKQRVIAIVYQGPDAVKRVRDLAGPTNPHDARQEKPGCIRSLGTVVPLTDAEGKIIGERMDNLIHASATPEEAEHEIKLWFRTSEIPPFMRAFPVQQNEEVHFYYKDDKLYTQHEPGSTCVLAPGDVMWESDITALGLISEGKQAPCTLQAVVAKYLTNETPERQ